MLSECVVLNVPVGITYDDFDDSHVGVFGLCKLKHLRCERGVVHAVFGYGQFLLHSEGVFLRHKDVLVRHLRFLIFGKLLRGRLLTHEEHQV